MNRIRQWLDDTKNWWAVAALALGVYSFYQAVTFNRWTIAGWPRPSLIGAVAGIIFGAAHFAGQRWSRWFCVAWIALAAVVQVINGATLGWSVWRILGLATVALMAVFGYLIFFRDEESDEEGENKPFLSLVLLLREPRYLDATILAQVASRAWDIDVTASNDAAETDEEDAEYGETQAEAAESNDDEKTGFITGEAPLYMGMHPSAVFIIHQRDEPYLDDLEEVAQQITELRTRKAILDHRAWIAVDIMHWFGEGNGIEESYRLIARLLAELADDNVLAIVDPDASQIFCYDPETEQKLRSDNPLAALREWYYSPIVQVRADDPRMQAAVAEAHERWNEFVAAFETRSGDDDTPFAVKAPFNADDNTEFMWVEVTGIENDVVYGLLKNEPADIPNLHEGDRVKVAVPDINDWLAVIDGEPVGGFTIKLLSEEAKRPPAADNESGT